MDYYEIKIKYSGVGENGEFKYFTDVNIVTSFTFSEAEANLAKALESSQVGEYTIENFKRLKLEEILHDPSKEYCYKIAMVFESFNEDSQKTALSTSYWYIDADNMSDAIKIIIERMEGSITDWKIKTIAEYPLNEFFDFNNQGKLNFDGEKEYTGEVHENRRAVTKKPLREEEVEDNQAA